MGEPIIIWPPCGGNEYGDACQGELETGFYDCSDYYYYLLQPGEIACCPSE
jgi:hypothetical protein